MANRKAWGVLYLTALSIMTPSVYGFTPDCLENFAEALIDEMPKSASHPLIQDSKNRITEVQPMMWISSSNLDSIEKYGFLNQHQTQTSAATIDPVLRARAEMKMQKLDEIQGVSDLPAELFPKYGVLNYVSSGDAISISPSSLDEESGGRTDARYGELMVRFKSSLLKRASYSMKDSLAGYSEPTSKASSKSSELAALRTKFQSKSPSRTHQNQNQDQKQSQGLGASQVFPGSDLIPLFEFQSQKRKAYGFIETQIWGNLTVNSVEEFWLPKVISSNSKNLVIAFAKHYGIPVFQMTSVVNRSEHIPNQRVPVYQPADSDPHPALTSTLSPSHLISTYQSLSDSEESHLVEKNIIESILADREVTRDLSSLPDEIANRILGKIKKTRNSFMKLVLSEEAPVKLRLQGLKCLVSEHEAEPWLLRPDYLHLMEVLKQEGFRNITNPDERESIEGKLKQILMVRAPQQNDHSMNACDHLLIILLPIGNQTS